MTRQLGFRFLITVLLLVALPAAAEDPAAATTETGGEPAAGEIVAYYFHGNFRCATCRTIEAYSKEAISKGFADELAAGQLVWRTVNTDEEEHKHFVKDFELVTKSLVLVEYRDGEVQRYQNLKLVWQLVRDKDGFLKYVRDATREFIGQKE